MDIITTRQKVGLVLAGVLSAFSIPSVLVPTPDGEVGPPFAILVLSTALGLVGLVAVVIAWRGASRVAIRVVAGSLIIGALITLPAFFVDVPPVVKMLSGLSVLISVLAIVLMFSPSRRSVPVLG